tara:strand:+ start:125 stop:451 length:327 start_codon:yes stop_codon:yes gene_type:complete
MRLPNIEWNLMNLVDLQRLRERLDQEIESREKKFDKIERVKQLIGEEGLTMEDLLQAGSKIPRRENKKADIKYRHPKKPELQWSGRGKRPVWLREELEKGRKLESFLA